MRTTKRLSLTLALNIVLLSLAAGLTACSEMTAVEGLGVDNQTLGNSEGGGEQTPPSNNPPPSLPPSLPPATPPIGVPPTTPPTTPPYSVGPLEVKDGSLMGRYMNVSALATRATDMGIQQCIYVNTCVAKSGFGPCMSISAPAYDVTKDPMCPASPPPTPAPTPVATPPPTATPPVTPPPPAPTPMPPTSGPYPMPSSCFGLDLIQLDFNSTDFHFSFYPGTGYVTKFTTGNIPGDVYGGRFSTAHDNTSFTTIISERPCDIQEAMALKLYSYTNIATSLYFVVADPSTGVKEKAIAKGDKYTIWLKPNTTYYAVSFYAHIDQSGSVVSLPEGVGYYYRQSHSNNPGTRNMLPRDIIDLIP